MFKKLFYKILTIIIFLIMTLSPVWSVVLVMQCEAGEFDPTEFPQMPTIERLRYHGETWIDKQYYDARFKAKVKHTGLEVKYVKL